MQPVVFIKHSRDFSSKSQNISGNRQNQLRIRGLLIRWVSKHVRNDHEK